MVSVQSFEIRDFTKVRHKFVGILLFYFKGSRLGSDEIEKRVHIFGHFICPEDYITFFVKLTEKMFCMGPDKYFSLSFVDESVDGVEDNSEFFFKEEVWSWGCFYFSWEKTNTVLMVQVKTQVFKNEETVLVERL